MSTKTLPSCMDDFNAKVKAKWELLAQAHEAQALSYDLHAQADEDEDPYTAAETRKMADSYRTMAKEAREFGAKFK